jgi:hypothetical protein
MCVCVLTRCVLVVLATSSMRMVMILLQLFDLSTCGKLDCGRLMG